MLSRSKCFHLLGAAAIAALLLLLVGQTLAQGLPPQRNIVLVIDQSFSYSGSGHATGQEHRAMLERIVPAIELQCPDCWLGVMMFAEEITTVVPLQPLNSWITDTYASLLVPGSLGNGTNFVDALVEAADQLLDDDAPEAAERRIVLLTDLQLDTYTYKAQEIELLELVTATLVQEGIQLMVIGRSPQESEALWWDRELIQRTGGWYLEPDGIGADDASFQTLLFAFSKPPDPITMEDGAYSSCMEIPFYQRNLTVKIPYSGDISATLRSSSTSRLSGSRKDGQIDFEAAYPDAGEWCATVVGTGTFQIFFMPTTGLQFDLALTGNPQPRLPVGADLDVTYRVSLVEQPGRAIMDEQMMVHAWLADENGRLISDLSVTPDLDAQLYRAHFAGEPWLEGTYYVEVEANAAWLSAPLRDDPLPVIWGRVPRFDGPPQAVASTPIRIENPFTVTAALLNVDTVSAPLLVRLQVVEQASGGTVYSQRNECDETCTFVIPALQTEGAYTVTATLYEGRTAQNVVYSPGQQERAYTVVEVGPLVFPQLWLRFMRLNWPLMLGAVVAFLFALMLLWRFGYRARIVAVRDFDTLRSRL